VGECASVLLIIQSVSASSPLMQFLVKLDNLFTRGGSKLASCQVLASVVIRCLNDVLYLCEMNDHLLIHVSL